MILKYFFAPNSPMFWIRLAEKREEEEEEEEEEEQAVAKRYVFHANAIIVHKKMSIIIDY